MLAKRVYGKTSLQLSYLILFLQSWQKHSLFYAQMSVNHRHRQNDRLQLGDHKLKAWTAQKHINVTAHFLIFVVEFTATTQPMSHEIAYLGSVWRCFTCQGPEVVRIQVLPECFFGCLWDLRTQNTGRGTNSDIISANWVLKYKVNNTID